jgi:alkyl hydroperoxide reductase subunit AhpF
MPILSNADREYLRQVFAERLVDPVTIRLYTQKLAQLTIPGYECMTCRETNELMEEFASLSDKIELEVLDLLQAKEQAARERISEIPAIVLEGKNKGTVRFIGAPAGYEFGTLVEDVIDISRGTTALQPLSREILAKLARPVHIQVFVTPT